MIAELGLAALWLAAALCVLQLAAAFASLKGGTMAVVGDAARPAAMLQALLVTVSFAALAWCFAVTDLSVQLVAANSHADKPLLYKLTGTWGNHEGSMLLWVSVMGLAGALIAGAERRLPERTMHAVLGAQAFVSLGFYAFLLLASNPFARLDEPPAQGMGLNPLLQDIGLALHPPTLYFGYVGLSVAFSFAVGALLTREVTPAFARAMRPWVLGAWVFLTLGITAGSYWAYYELGWGGWWFWDPVENASLMPWLAATALLHSVSVLAMRDALRTWTIMLGVVAFSMSMLGTFLVRSGILTSVHAFAVDPGRGAFILVLLAIYIGGALLLFGLRAGVVTEGTRFDAVSREGALVANNILLSAILAIVLLGTFYPLFAEAMGQRVSVGPPYFDAASAVFVVPLLLIMAAGPLLRWRRDDWHRVRGPIAVSLAAGFLVLATVAAWTQIGFLPLLGLALAAVLALASLLPLRGRSLRRVPLPTWGMVVAHLGIAVALFGIASDSAFSRETLVAMRPGDDARVGPWQVTLRRVDPVVGPNWTALESQLLARPSDEPQATPYLLQPQSRAFWSPEQQTSEVALLTGWNGQLYTVLGEEGVDGRWQVRLWWKPFVTLIWLGGGLVALGGVLSLLGRAGKARQQGRARRRRAERTEALA